MIYAFLAVLIGLYLLVASADKFVDSATKVAYHFSISPFIVGITIVAFGTSAPEMVISAMAAWSGTPNMAIGNAIGSNIANIGLVLGVTALLVPLPFKRSLLRVEIPVLIMGSLLAGLVLWNLQLGMLDGVILLTSLIISFYFLMRYPTSETIATAPVVNKKELSSKMNANPADNQWGVLWLVLSIVVMVLAARILVWGASAIATALGVSDLIIGLTIVAIGTSLPELATSIASVYKKQYDIAIGNIIGSNTFNILAVMAIPGLIHPTILSKDVLWRDYGTMLLLTLMLLGFCLMTKNNTIGRIKGGVLLALYAGYNAILYLSALS